jgi:hypothetical protein
MFLSEVDVCMCTVSFLLYFFELLFSKNLLNLQGQAAEAGSPWHQLRICPSFVVERASL